MKSPNSEGLPRLWTVSSRSPSSFFSRTAFAASPNSSSRMANHFLIAVVLFAPLLVLGFSLDLDEVVESFFGNFQGFLLSGLKSRESEFPPTAFDILQVCTPARLHICRIVISHSFQRGLSLRESSIPITTVPSISIKSTNPIMKISSSVSGVLSGYRASSNAHHRQNTHTFSPISPATRPSNCSNVASGH